MQLIIGSDDPPVLQGFGGYEWAEVSTVDQAGHAYVSVRRTNGPSVQPSEEDLSRIAGVIQDAANQVTAALARLARERHQDATVRRRLTALVEKIGEHGELEDGWSEHGAARLREILHG
jgi:hypothetical protein